MYSDIPERSLPSAPVIRPSVVSPFTHRFRCGRDDSLSPIVFTWKVQGTSQSGFLLLVVRLREFILACCRRLWLRFHRLAAPAFASRLWLLSLELHHLLLAL